MLSDVTEKMANQANFALKNAYLQANLDEMTKHNKSHGEGI